MSSTLDVVSDRAAASARRLANEVRLTLDVDPPLFLFEDVDGTTPAEFEAMRAEVVAPQWDMTVSEIRAGRYSDLLLLQAQLHRRHEVVLEEYVQAGHDARDYTVVLEVLREEAELHGADSKLMDALGKPDGVLVPRQGIFGSWTWYPTLTPEGLPLGYRVEIDDEMKEEYSVDADEVPQPRDGFGASSTWEDARRTLEDELGPETLDRQRRHFRYLATVLFRLQVVEAVLEEHEVFGHVATWGERPRPGRYERLASSPEIVEICQALVAEYDGALAGSITSRNRLYEDAAARLDDRDGSFIRESLKKRGVEIHREKEGRGNARLGLRREELDFVLAEARAVIAWNETQ